MYNAWLSILLISYLISTASNLLSRLKFAYDLTKDLINLCNLNYQFNFCQNSVKISPVQSMNILNSIIIYACVDLSHANIHGKPLLSSTLLNMTQYNVGKINGENQNYVTLSSLRTHWANNLASTYQGESGQLLTDNAQVMKELLLTVLTQYVTAVTPTKM